MKFLACILMSTYLVANTWALEEQNTDVKAEKSKPKNEKYNKADLTTQKKTKEDLVSSSEEDERDQIRSGQVHPGARHVGAYGPLTTAQTFARKGSERGAAQTGSSQQRTNARNADRHERSAGDAGMGANAVSQFMNVHTAARHRHGVGSDSDFARHPSIGL